MVSVFWFVFVGLMAAAIVFDARSYRIPNWISLALIAAFVPAVLFSGQPVLGFWIHVAVAAGMLAVGYGLFALTGMGAGDAKLAASLCLWAGLKGLYPWFVAFAVGMALLALGLIAIRAVVNKPVVKGERPNAFQKGAPVPLGVAIAGAGIFASFWFDPALWSI